MNFLAVNGRVLSARICNLAQTFSQQELVVNTANLSQQNLSQTQNLSQRNLSQTKYSKSLLFVFCFFFNTARACCLFFFLIQQELVVCFFIQQELVLCFFLIQHSEQHLVKKFLKHFRLAKRFPMEEIRRSVHVDVGGASCHASARGCHGDDGCHAIMARDCFVFVHCFFRNK